MKVSCKPNCTYGYLRKCATCSTFVPDVSWKLAWSMSVIMADSLRQVHEKDCNVKGKQRGVTILQKYQLLWNGKHDWCFDHSAAEYSIQWAINQQQNELSILTNSKYQEMKELCYTLLPNRFSQQLCKWPYKKFSMACKKDKCYHHWSVWHIHTGK